MNILQKFAIHASAYLEAHRDKIRARRQEYDSFKESLPLQDPRLDALCASYRPTLTQSDLNSRTHEHPEPTAILMRDEMVRIRDYLEPLTMDWPLHSKDRILQALMQKVWREMMAKLHVEVFGSMDLPPFYRIHFGFCSYEDVFQRRDSFNNIQHVGTQSGYNYGQVMPILWRHLT